MAEDHIRNEWSAAVSLTLSTLRTAEPNTRRPPFPCICSPQYDDRILVVVMP
jgi:hypothetical protein